MAADTNAHTNQRQSRLISHFCILPFFLFLLCCCHTSHLPRCQIDRRVDRTIGILSKPGREPPHDHAYPFSRRRVQMRCARIGYRHFACSLQYLPAPASAGRIGSRWIRHMLAKYTTDHPSTMAGHPTRPMIQRNRSRQSDRAPAGTSADRSSETCQGNDAFTRWKKLPLVTPQLSHPGRRQTPSGSPGPMDIWTGHVGNAVRSIELYHRGCLPLQIAIVPRANRGRRSTRCDQVEASWPVEMRQSLPNSTPDVFSRDRTDGRHWKMFIFHPVAFVLDGALEEGNRSFRELLPIR